MKKKFLFILTALLFAGIAIFGSEVKEINDFLNQIEIGKEINSDGLTIFPIHLKKNPVKSSFIMLDEALSKKYLLITESDGGNVPKVKITNLSDKMIYIMGGEIITGCKQDRIVARDTIIGPKKKDLSVPVFCVEQGRWSYNSNNFYSKKNLGTSRLRSEAQKSASDSQTEIWNEVSNYVAKNKVNSNSRAYQDVYEDKDVKEKIEKIEAKVKSAIKFDENTIGFVIAIGSKIISLDLFGDALMFKNIYEKILKSSMLSLVSDEVKGTVSSQDVVKFIGYLKNNDYTKREAVDLGNEAALVNKDINANALMFDNRLIHTSAFPVEEKVKKNSNNQINEELLNSRDYIQRR